MKSTKPSRHSKSRSLDAGVTGRSMFKCLKNAPSIKRVRNSTIQFEDRMKKLTLNTVRTADMQEVTSMKMKTMDIEMQESERKLSAFRSELSELNSEKH